MDRADAKLAFLIDKLALPPGGYKIDDLEYDWLISLGATPGHINDMYLEVFLLNGATSEEYNTAAYEFLIAAGVTPAALPDMWYEYWLGGGSPPPAMGLTIEQNNYFGQPTTGYSAGPPDGLYGDPAYGAMNPDSPVVVTGADGGPNYNSGQYVDFTALEVFGGGVNDANYITVNAPLSDWPYPLTPNANEDMIAVTVNGNGPHWFSIHGGPTTGQLRQITLGGFSTQPEIDAFANLMKSLVGQSVPIVMEYYQTRV